MKLTRVAKIYVSYEKYTLASIVKGSNLMYGIKYMDDWESNRGKSESYSFIRSFGHFASCCIWSFICLLFCTMNGNGKTFSWSPIMFCFCVQLLIAVSLVMLDWLVSSMFNPMEKKHIRFAKLDLATHIFTF